jgi:hypothetical protein
MNISGARTIPRSWPLVAAALRVVMGAAARVGTWVHRRKTITFTALFDGQNAGRMVPLRALRRERPIAAKHCLAPLAV